MYLDLGRWITGSAWCWSGPYRPEGASLLPYDSMLSTYQGNIGDSEPPDILYETCACIIHTINLQLHVHLLLKHSTINLSLTPNQGTQGPRDSHDVSVYETCACVIYSASYMCALLSFHINVCAGYMCFVKL